MIELIVVMLLLVGSVISLIAAIGLLRLPDVFIRMHASTKAGTLGIELVMVACALHFNEPAAWLKAAIVVLFIVITAPVAAHMLGRAAYRLGEDFAKHTVRDDWQDNMRKKNLLSKEKMDDTSKKLPENLP